jgi:hypothetical protein
LDIDSDVYPELYTNLAVILSAGGRSERVRQLAAGGLVWETLRIKGHAPPIADAPVASKARAAAAPPSNLPGAKASPRAAQRVAPGEPGSVDIAIDMPQAPPRSDAVAPRNIRRALEAGKAELPVLRDVLEPEPAPSARHHADEPNDAAAEPSQPLWPQGSLLPPPSTRSRLKRMKERGLFKNG